VLADQLAAAETAFAEAEAALEQAESLRVEAREAAARLEARLERAQAEAAGAESALLARRDDLPADTDQDSPDAGALAGLESELARLGAARERLGPVNLRAIEEAAELAMRIETMESEMAELSGAIERLRRAISTLNREGRERLRAAFAKVERHFEALFTRLFGGRNSLSLGVACFRCTPSHTYGLICSGSTSSALIGVHPLLRAVLYGRRRAQRDDAAERWSREPPAAPYVVGSCRAASTASAARECRRGNAFLACDVRWRRGHVPPARYS
jgi:hypothetical protein